MMEARAVGEFDGPISVANNPDQIFACGLTFATRGVSGCSIDTHVADTYDITFYAMDSSGLQSETVTRKLVVIHRVRREKWRAKIHPVL